MRLLPHGSPQWVRRSLAVLVSAGLVLSAAGPAQQASAAEGDAAAKTVYDSDGKKLENGAEVSPGETLTYAVGEDGAASRGDGARTLTDTMSSNQKYEKGSLKKRSGSYPGLEISEPDTSDWSKGEDIARFDPSAEARSASADADPTGEPVWGKNSQRAEALSSPEAPRMPNLNGDGMNPTIAYNKAGEQIVWSLNHHVFNPNLPCEMTGSREDCSNNQVFGSDQYLTPQNQSTHTYNKTTGLAAVLKRNSGGSTVDSYAAAFDFSDVKPGTAPKKTAEVKILSNVIGTWDLLSWQSTGLFESNGKYYQIGFRDKAGNDDEMVLGCFDPEKNSVCDGFSADGNTVASQDVRADGTPRVRGELPIADGKFAFTVTRGGLGEAYCVKPKGTTLVNCDESETVKPLKLNDSDSIVVLPTVSEDESESAVVPEIENAGQERKRVTGFCRGGIGYNKDVTECYDVNGKSIGMPYKGYQTYGELHTRVNDAFAYPAGAAQVVYPLYYARSNGLGSCYDFAKKAKCDANGDVSAAEVRDGATWKDQQTVGDQTYNGMVYGARMVPETANCMVSRGDGNGKGMFLYWLVGENGQNKPAGSNCLPLDVHFVDQSDRYCAPGDGGMTEWGDLVLTTSSADRKEKQLASAPTIEYYEYDPETGKTGEAIGDPITLEGTGPKWTVPKPDFLNYKDTKNFTVKVVTAEPDTVYSFVQEHEADGQPSVCYDAKVIDQCTAEPADVDNKAQWSGAAAATTKLRTAAGGQDCLNLEKTINGKPADNGDGTYTVSYDVKVSTTPDADAPQKYTLADKPDFAKGTDIKSWSVKAGENTPAVDPAIDGAEYREPGTIADDVEIKPNEVHTYTVSFVVAGVSSIAAEDRECEAAPGGPGKGFFNQAILNPGDGQITDEDCGDVPTPKFPEFAVQKDKAQAAASIGDDGKWSADYTVTVKNTGSLKGTSAAVVDTPSVPGGFTVTGAAVDGANVDIADGKFTVADGVELEPGESKAFAVTLSGDYSADSADWKAAGECDVTGEGDPSKGFFNRVAMDGDSDGPENNDACVPGHTPKKPGISLIKKINGYDAPKDAPVYIEPGTKVDVTFVVANTGSTTLDNVKVKDDTIPADQITAPAKKHSADGKEAGEFTGSLEPGEYAVFSAPFTSPKSGVHRNVATAEGDVPPGDTPTEEPSDNPTGEPTDGPSETPTEPSEPPTVTSPPDDANMEVPSLKLVKYINGDDANEAPGVKVQPGEDMKVTYKIKNTGEVDLSDITVADVITEGDKGKVDPASISCPKPDLKSGEEMECSTTIPAPEGWDKQHTDVAYAEGTPPSNPPAVPGLPGEPTPPQTPNGTVKSNEDPANAHTPKKPESPVPSETPSAPGEESPSPSDEPTPPADGQTPPAAGGQEPPAAGGQEPPAAAPEPPAKSSPLPRTGAELAAYAAAGLLLVVGGSLVVMAVRRRKG